MEGIVERILGRIPVLFRWKITGRILGRILGGIPMKIPREFIEKILKNFLEEFWKDSMFLDRIYERIPAGILGILSRQKSRRIPEKV